VNSRKRVGFLMGIAVLLAGCTLPTDPVVVEVLDGSSYSTPQEAGVIDVEDGTEFEFYSTVGGFSAVVRFQVPAGGQYDFHYRGRDLFDVAVRLTQMGAAVVTFEHDITTTALLAAGTDYYLEIDQTDGAMMGGTFVTIWAD
jgi:hypothetical protein